MKTQLFLLSVLLVTLPGLCVAQSVDVSTSVEESDAATDSAQASPKTSDEENASADVAGRQQDDEGKQPTETPIDDDASHANQESIKRAYELGGPAFIFVMFTNAIVCGQWASQTKRSSWGGYLAGLLTGPLAGGCMLFRTAVDESGDPNPGGCLGALTGLRIPAAGWFFWLAVLSESATP